MTRNNVLRSGSSRTLDAAAGELAGRRRGGPTAALVALGSTRTTARRLALVAGLLRDLAAGADAMAALPRLDHLAPLANRPLQLGDPRIALAQRLLQLGDALGVRHAASGGPVATKKQGRRARPAAGLADARPTAPLIELNRYIARMRAKRV